MQETLGPIQIGQGEQGRGEENIAIDMLGRFELHLQRCGYLEFSHHRSLFDLYVSEIIYCLLCV